VSAKESLIAKAAVGATTMVICIGALWNDIHFSSGSTSATALYQFLNSCGFCRLMRWITVEIVGIITC